MSQTPGPRTDYRNGLRWRVHGVPNRMWRDVYPRLMGASWTVTIAVVFAAYIGCAVLFAGLFAIEPGGVNGASTFSDMLWFSIQTLSTIGYGGMTPASPWANLLVILESFIGLAGVAVLTAILYAKFSLPDARVRFSNVLAVHDRLGVPTLHLRMANERISPILDAHIHVGVLIDEDHGEQRFRRLVDLELARTHIPVFAMAFTVMHSVDADSPLRAIGDDPDRLQFLIITLRGVDGRTLQPTYARAIYLADQVRLHRGFADMVSTGADGVLDLDMAKIDDLVERELNWELEEAG